MKRKNRSVKNIWMLTREYGELAGTGGVKDVAMQLSRTLANWSGREVNVALPLYGFILPESYGFVPLADPHHSDKNLEFDVDMNYVSEERRETLRVWYLRQERVNIYLLDSSRFFEKKDVYTYNDEDERNEPWKKQGEGHFDYFAMNLLLQKGALQLIILLQQRPDIIHCHDGHTAVLPAIIHETPWLKSYFRSTGCVVTIHNAGRGYHQEVTDLAFARAMTGLPSKVILESRLNDSFDPFIAAGHYAMMNTVSENYARELQETVDDEMTDWLGHHLLDMEVKLEGVTNGIDPADFNPARGVELGLGFSFDPLDDSSMEGKGKCKNLLISQLASSGEMENVDQYGLLEVGGDRPLFTFISRLSGQKGIDILLEATRLLLGQEKDCQIIIFGSGSAEIENGLIEVAAEPGCHGRVCFLRGYSANLANRIYGAGDFFLIPSRYEPCGLTDFIAQLFGNLPVVHHVGGLVKVIDGETGFAYENNSPENLFKTMQRAITVYQNPQMIRKMQKQAVQQIEKNYSWKVVMQRYLKLYQKAMNPW